jgi:hypothetical protein
VVILLLIRLACARPPPVEVGTFPPNCYATWYGATPLDCVRVAPGATSQQLAGIVTNASEPLFAKRAPTSTISGAIDEWASSLFQTSVVANERGVLHASVCYFADRRPRATLTTLACLEGHIHRPRLHRRCLRSCHMRHGLWPRTRRGAE